MSGEAQEVGLYALLILSFFASCLCLGSALGMLGAKLIQRQYQQAAGIDGTTRIQSGINIRTYAMRAALGITFALFAALLWADAPMIWRQWINRTLFVALPLGYFLSTLLDWRAENAQMRIELDQEAERRITTREQATQQEVERTTRLQADHDSYREMAQEAVASLEALLARGRESRGQEAAPAMAAIVAEHSSPITPNQQSEADRQTIRARLTAATLEGNLPPREAPSIPDPNLEVDVATIQPAAIAEITQAVRDAGQEKA